MASWFHSMSSVQLEPKVEVHTLRVTHPQHGQLRIRRTALLSQNGFRRGVRTQILWARKDQALAFATREEELTGEIDEPFRLGDHGALTSQGGEVRWDLSWNPAQDPQTQWLPTSLMRLLSRLGRTPTRVSRVFSDQPVQGTLTWRDQTVDWSGARAHATWMTGRFLRKRFVWVRALDCTADGTSARLSIEGYATPLFAGIAAQSFEVNYKGTLHRVLGLTRGIEAQWNRVAFDLTSTSENGVVFRGAIEAQQKSLASVSFEDPAGKIAYSSGSAFAEMTLSVYRDGQLEATFRAPLCDLEIVTPNSNPYTTLLT